jgi:2-iminobutanoate/2-iminopropanoate deaminase
MVARRMKDIFVKGPDVQGNRDGIDVEDSRVRVDEALWYYSDQIGLRDYVQSLQVVRNG